MTPRASRTADIAASVPDDTNRTFSIEGTASATTSAISISRTVGAPKLDPRSRASATAVAPGDGRVPGSSGPTSRCNRCRSGRRCRRDKRPGTGNERRLAADGAERPRRAVDTARDHLVGPHEGLVAGGKAEVGSGSGGGGCVHGRCRESLRSHSLCRGVITSSQSARPSSCDEYAVDQMFKPVQVGDRLDLGLEALRVSEPDPAQAQHDRFWLPQVSLRLSPRLSLREGLPGKSLILSFFGTP